MSWMEMLNFIMMRPVINWRAYTGAGVNKALIIALSRYVIWRRNRPLQMKPSRHIYGEQSGPSLTKLTQTVKCPPGA